MRLLVLFAMTALLTGCASVIVPLEQAKTELAAYATRDPAILRERWGYLAAAEGKYLWPDDIQSAPTFRRWIIPGAILEVDEYNGRERGEFSGHFNTYRYNPQTKTIEIFSWHSGERRGEARVNRDGSVSIHERSGATFTHRLSREGVHVVSNVFGVEWTWREIPKEQFLAQMDVLEDDRRAERRRSSRETSNALTAIAQGVVGVAGAVTAQPTPATRAPVPPPPTRSRPNQVRPSLPGPTSTSSAVSPGARPTPSTTSTGGRPGVQTAQSSRPDSSRVVPQERTTAASTRPGIPAGKPIRFMLLIAFNPNGAWESNRHCYSNVVEGPQGPPGWGSPKLESTAPAQAIVYRYFDQFKEKCRAIAPLGANASRPQIIWNETSDERFERAVREYVEGNTRRQGSFGRVTIDR
jgi:hypothetical protein